MNLVNKVISQKYRILEKIAEGGMSIVWLARDISKGIDVAIKVLKKDVTSNRVEDIIRFKNEAFTVSKLQEQSIAKIYDVGEDDGIYYIAMEFLKGQSLFDAINRDRKFTIKESVQIIEKVCNALKCIHNAGVLHRDIKPGNLIINDENSELEVKLIDFGVSQVRDFDISDTSEIVGTLHYMSPEQSGVVNRMVDERSDLYSLGVVFYQLLAHQLPFKGETLVTLIHQHVAKIPDSLIQFNHEVPQILEKIVLKLLEKEPENRYQSANGLLADLDKFKNGQSDFIPGQQENIIKLNYRANLIGRDEEFSKLTELFSNSLNGNGKICFIDGEAGKGKTRLTEELRNHVYTLGGLIVDAKCFPGDSKAPYGVFSDILNSFLKVYSRFENDKKAIIKQKLKKSVGELGRILLKLNPLIEEILGDCAELVPLEHDVENKRFQMVVSKFFCDLCFTHDRGFLIVLDDLHWIDEGSLTILKNMSNQIDNYPVLIIGTYRSNEINDEHILQKFINSKSSAGKSLEEIHLQDFNMDVMQRFISRLLFDNGDTIKEIASFIFQKSKGNPFFSIF